MTVKQYHRSVERERGRHSEALARLTKNLRVLQRTCKHERLVYNDDPAGGNDDYNTCLDCGKEF